MKLFEEKINSCGKVLDGNILKVDAFLNHQIDVALLDEMGKEFYRLYKDAGITKILTIEASGIAIAIMAARHFGVPMVFAKKGRSANISDEVYHSDAFSFTHKETRTIVVSKEYLSKDDTILLIDDFLANGESLAALVDICSQAGAKVAGAGIAIEKEYQNGGNKLRAKGLRIESLAKIAKMDKDGITYMD